MIKSLLIMTTIFFFTPLFADTTVTIKNIYAELNEKIPQSKIDEIISMDYEGFYAIISAHEMMYYHEPSHLLIDGQIIDLQKKINISSQMHEMLLARLYTKLPLQKAIKLVNGTGQKQVVMFTDPHCRYCMTLANTLHSIQNITVYVMPIPFLGTQSKETLQKIYCTTNVKHSWLEWEKTKRLPENLHTKCDSLENAKDTEEFYHWSQRLGISGLPALLFPNGQMISGSIPKKHIENILNGQ